ncbi:phosphate acetyltransferase [Corynebacterium renale]|uniref:phosphate acetyltransferase n=1 Tax=Corynebacterium renale TaxID=1724 RepID=UPI00403FBCE1
MPILTSQSVIVTVANRTVDDLDVASLAQELGAATSRLSATTIAEVLAQAPTEPTVVVGTGAPLFDAEAAAALGLPLVLVAEGEGPQVDLISRDIAATGAHLVATVAAGELATVAPAVRDADVKPVMSADLFETWLLEKAASAKSHIVLPEGGDDRILQAAHTLLARDVAELTILGDQEGVAKRAQELGLNLDGAHVVDHLTSDRAEEYAAAFAELRKKKGVTIEQTREQMKDESYFATMMVQAGHADGMVSGAAHTTAETIRPAFQIIKTAPDASVVSSIFLMVMRGRLWAFGDCAVNPNPTPEQLGEIAVVSARTAHQFGIDPKVAMLSYSTGASGAGPDVEAVVAAVEKARELNPELAVDGPLQFDAACEPSVAAKKAPESPVAGQANVFIFPDLQSGNIGYKTAQRTGGALAVGPILQGLNKPINDLSRGATVPDIINTVAITAIQAGGAS